MVLQVSTANAIAFVVPACNESEYIGDTVDAILGAVDELGFDVSHELVVVDDGSVDGTAEIAEQHGAKVVRVNDRNIAAARNAGAAATSGDLLVFVDADTRPSVALIRETLQAARARLVWGTALASLWDSHPWWVKIGLPLFNWYYVNRRKCGYGFYFVVTRDAFNQVDGFSTTSAEGEDMAFSKSLLAAYGPPTVFQSRIATSARKARTFGITYHLKMLWLGLRHGDAMYTHPSIEDYRNGEQRLSVRE